MVLPLKAQENLVLQRLVKKTPRTMLLLLLNQTAFESQEPEASIRANIKRQLLRVHANLALIPTHLNRIKAPNLTVLYPRPLSVLPYGIGKCLVRPSRPCVVTFFLTTV